MRRSLLPRFLPGIVGWAAVSEELLQELASRNREQHEGQYGHAHAETQYGFRHHNLPLILP